MRRRGTLLAVLLCTLFQTGTCVQIAERSTINGFFDAVNAVLAQQLAGPTGGSQP